MSILKLIFGRRPAPPPPPPPPAPPRGDLLTLTGTGLGGVDLTGAIEVTIKVADRTFTAATALRAPGEYALHDFREIVPEPEPEPAVIAASGEYALHDFREIVPEPEPEPAVIAADEPEFVAAEDAPEVVAAVEEAPEVVAAVEEAPEVVAAVEEAPEVVAVDEPGYVADVVAPEVDPLEIAVVRRPLTDAEGAVVGYELVTGGGAGTHATAGLLLDAFGDIGLERLAGRHPAWVTLTPEFLLEVGTPPVRPDKVVLQIPAAPVSDDVVSALRRLLWSGYAIALDGYDPALADVCRIVKLPVAGRGDEELAAAVAEPALRGLELVATGVETPEDLARCKALGFTTFQGDFFAKPNLTRQRRVGTGGVASLKALAEVAMPDATFEDLERAISSDVGLSLKLLRYINSAFFALPRTVESVREALTLLGTATIRRWATVMALASATDAPEELVELALQRARMCEVLGGNRALDASDGHFTVGLFSVADALLDAPMEDVLETLPFSDEIRAALLHRVGPKGELLTTVVAYEQAEFPAGDGEVSLAGAYGDAVEWAGGAVRAAA
jgi:c-di-GMP phosphodiesterase